MNLNIKIEQQHLINDHDNEISHYKFAKIPFNLRINNKTTKFL